MGVSRGEVKRLKINIPPGCMKSLLVSVFWPAWEWAVINPGMRYLTLSYSDDLTIRDNMRVRDIVTSEWFETTFNFSLGKGERGKERFNTSAKGWRVASSIGGLGTGEHPHRIIIDDAIKAKDSGGTSTTAIENCNDWYSRTIPTRANLDPAIIIIMQRLHVNDLCAYVEQKGIWTNVILPMRYVPKQPLSNTYPKGWTPDPDDPRTSPGELLWPDKFPLETVNEQAVYLGPYGEAAQHQQHPIPEGGGLFQRDWFEIVDSLPPTIVTTNSITTSVIWVRGWDTAKSKKELSNNPDWTVGVKMCRFDNGIIYITDVIRLRKTLIDGDILTTAQNDGKIVKIREGSGSGKDVIASRAILLAGYDYDSVPETASKTDRAAPFRSQCSKGLVKLLRAPWNDAFLSVVCSFPVGAHDDDVDACSTAFNGIMGVGVVRPSLTWGRRAEG